MLLWLLSCRHIWSSCRVVARHRAGMVRVGKGAGGGVAVRALEGGGVDVVVEVGWWHQVGHQPYA